MLQILSNLKIITGGVAPTTAELGIGQAAFGRITADGLYHFYGNSGGADGLTSTVVDLILSSAGAIPSLDEVLGVGDTTAIAINFDDDSGTTTVIGVGNLTISNGTRILSITPANGFMDGTYPVLSANPANTISAGDATTMRNFLSVYSKAEVDALIVGVYRPMGSIGDFQTLTDNTQAATDPYVPEKGDVWNIETAGGIDMHGDPIKAGDNVVFIGPDPETDWDVLSGIVDLTNYYTISEISGLLSALQALIPTKTSDLENDSDFLADPDGDLIAAIGAIVLDGDGTLVLTDNGTYQAIQLVVAKI
jgi:hypothetical protein